MMALDFKPGDEVEVFTIRGNHEVVPLLGLNPSVWQM